MSAITDWVLGIIDPEGVPVMLVTEEEEEEENWWDEEEEPQSLMLTHAEFLRPSEMQIETALDVSSDLDVRLTGETLRN